MRNVTIATMNIIPRLLSVSFLLLAMISPQEALAGGCSSTGCPVQPAPATASPSHTFTATGGSRVAVINLSPEALDGINAGVNAAGKEEPLPKGFVTAADRQKIIARQQPLYGWPQDEVQRPSSRAQRHDSTATPALRNSRARVPRALAGPVKPVTAVKVATTAKAKSQN